MTRGSSHPVREIPFAALLCVVGTFAWSGCQFKVSSPSEAPSVQPTTLSTSATDKKPETFGQETVEPASQVATAPANETPTSEKPTAGKPVADTPAAESKRPLPEVIIAVTFDDLNLQMQADMAYRDWMLTDRAKELDGHRIRIVGTMLSDGQLKGVKEFVLLRNKECKFGPGGQADHLISVKLKAGQEVSYTTNSVQIEGILKIRPVNGPDGNTWSLYDLATDSFKVLRK